MHGTPESRGESGRGDYTRLLELEDVGGDNIPGEGGTALIYPVGSECGWDLLDRGSSIGFAGKGSHGTA